MPKLTEDIKRSATGIFLFIGPPDSGKSYAASSFGYASKQYGGEDERPAYLMDTDGRELALRNRPVQYDCYTGVEGAIGLLNRLEELRNTCVQYEYAPFHTLIAPDSFSGFCDLCMGDAMGAKEGKTNRSGDAKGRKIGNLSAPTFEDYGYEAEAVRQLLWEHLFDLKRYCNVIVTAHEIQKFKTTQKVKGGPSTTEPDGYQVLARDKISAKLPTKFDEIYHFLGKEILYANNSVRRRVVFQDSLARTSYEQLNTLEEHDISGKQFYHWWMGKILQ